MKITELKKKGALYVENIQHGFEDYVYEVISLRKEDAEKLFLELRAKNGEENSFLDFYYFAVRPEERARIDSVLNQEEIQYLREYEKNRLEGNAKEEIIFPMEDMLLEIAVKLNEKSALFSTMYFLKEKSTWWGNYEGEYVKFRKKPESRNHGCKAEYFFIVREGISVYNKTINVKNKDIEQKY